MVLLLLLLIFATLLLLLLPLLVDVGGRVEAAVVFSKEECLGDKRRARMRGGLWCHTQNGGAGPSSLPNAHSSQSAVSLPLGFHTYRGCCCGDRLLACLADFMQP